MAGLEESVIFWSNCLTPALSTFAGGSSEAKFDTFADVFSFTTELGDEMGWPIFFQDVRVGKKYTIHL